MEKQDQPPDADTKAFSDDLLPDVLPVADSDEYEIFGLWMNVQLVQLIARWRHLAAPSANRAADKIDIGPRFSKPHKAK